MRKLFILFCLLLSVSVKAQSEQLAYNYFDRGEFDKAITLLEEIVVKQPGNPAFFQKMIECYQQLKQYDKAETAILYKMKISKTPTLYVELGYNFQLQKNEAKATENYNLAIEQVVLQSNYAYSVASVFEQKTLLDWAIKAYEVGKLGNPNLNFDYQIALLNGQMGNLDLMVEKLLDYSFSNQNNTPLVQNQLTRFISEDTEGNFTEYIKKALLIRVQKNQDIYWNQFLSWYFMQQKEYGKAFTQEKAIYKRNPEGFYNIVNLAKFAMEEKENETAKTIFQFILENTQDYGLQIMAHDFLISMQIEESSEKEYPVIQQTIESLVKQYGISPFTLELQLLSAHFDAFYMKQFDKAKVTLDNALSLRLAPRQESEVKMELADILVLDEKFNQAILYYAQISETLKNDEKSHEASMKMAETSYYKQDFDWALQQVKVLKQSSSLLIANDAIELFLLISDNSAEDSTRVALKAFSKADLLTYQNKNELALSQFLEILEKYKGDTIEDNALFKIAQIYEKKKDYTNALVYYKNILDNHSDGIYVDEALFFSAEIYRKYLNDNEKAKPLYEKMIFEHADSIHFTEARKQFRLLRGDAI
ncbi:tetratricopeptide repeat protein [Flavobacterium gelidilacus]|jgi:tetratricopeptide (TPR) repeat protein|uniref:tetratricopeptide repeat protein n=1 Tax=Flavobacterium gelidilacus TaxID=206041 RepID=UPI00041A56DD|nr:tetratricopeptide repeat protein [Flavobacterium gelidilacus]